MLDFEVPVSFSIQVFEFVVAVGGTTLKRVEIKFFLSIFLSRTLDLKSNLLVVRLTELTDLGLNLLSFLDI